MKKKKGFTLVELLAVIVILAVLVLVAVPSVVRMLESTKQNAFKVEAENIIKAGKNAYASEMLDGTFENGCYSLEKLAQYTDKNFDGYTGSVYIDSENNNDKVWLGNGDYIIAGSYSGNMVVTKLTSERPAPNNCDDMFVVTDPSGEGQTATTVQELMDRIEAVETENSSLRNDLTTANSNIADLQTELTTFKNNHDTQNTYSTTEHWTGKYWIDGKKIYRKTITGTVTTLGNQTNNWGINNLEQIVNFEIIGLNSGSLGFRSFPIIDQTHGTLMELVYIYYQNQLSWTSINFSIINSYHATLEYTKTTD